MGDSYPTLNIPIGWCQCGCGERTMIRRESHPGRGQIKGEPARFLSGHRRTKGYKQCTKTTSAVWHRVRAEAALGHPLPPGAVIHHPDRDPWNPDARLVICPSQSYHLLLHARMRVKEAGGNPNTDRICAKCKQVKPITEFSPTNCPTSRAIYMSQCRPCNRDLMRQRTRKAQPQPVIDTPPEPQDTNTL